MNTDKNQAHDYFSNLHVSDSQFLELSENRKYFFFQPADQRSINVNILEFSAVA